MFSIGKRCDLAHSPCRLSSGDKGVREEATFMAEAEMMVACSRLGVWRRKMILVLC